MNATTIYITDDQKQIFKEIKFISDKTMNEVVQDLLNEHLPSYLEKVKKMKKHK